jgi:aspartyl-tRNA(Asn)/glutamyl-tRNA(Gln) amidotransferase subunit A
MLTMEHAVSAELAGLDIVEAGRRLRKGAVRSTALTEACLARVGERNETLRAFVSVDTAGAMRQAAQADAELTSGHDRGPLHGIPIALKDLLDQAGVPTTAGSHVASSEPAAADAVVTARLRAAGAVIVGKTNLHEYAFGTTSEDSAFGAVRHPRDITRSAGGSSGGSAAAVLDGMAIAAVGTDTGGSVRIPSACCGLVGLKPTFGEVPVDGVVPLSTTLDHVGPIARTVADAAALHAVMARVAPRELNPPPADRLRLGRLRGYFEELLEPGIARAYELALARFERAGVTLVDVQVPHAADLPAIYLHIVLPEAAAFHAATLERCPERYTPGVRLRLEMGRYVLAEDYLRALAAKRVIGAEIDRALDGVDALVLPTLPIAAPLIGEESVLIGQRREPVRAAMLRLTQPFNLSGHPALALPCGAGLPLPASVQLVARHARTWRLLDMGAALAPLAQPRE